jgi:fatty acid desaturase
VQQLDREALVNVKQQLQAWSKPRPWIYWTDVLLSAAVGWTAFVGLLWVDTLGLRAICFAVAVIALYRAMCFTHELAHRDERELPGLRVVWHLLAGMPFGVPSFMYRDIHRLHHSQRTYGTPEDPEYLNFGHTGSLKDIALLIALPWMFPLSCAVRFLITAPASLCSRRYRKYVMRKASCFGIRLDFTREIPDGKQLAYWRWEEASTSVFMWLVVAALIAQWLPLQLVLWWSLLSASMMSLNSLRIFAGTHGYTSNGEAMSYEAQTLETTNLVHWRWLSVLVGPVGLSLHATHHLYPSLPYHALGQAHRLLMAEARTNASALEFYTGASHTHVAAGLANLLQRVRAARIARASAPPEQASSTQHV